MWRLLETMAVLRVRKVKKKYTPFLVSVPKDITQTRLVKRYFRSDEEAQRYIVSVRLDGFTNAERGRGNGEAPAGEKCGIRLAEAGAMFLSRSTDGRRSSTKAQLKAVMSRLEGQFGRRVLLDVSHRELEPWVNGVPGNYTTRYNHFRIARRFFQYCVDYLEVLPRNPFKKVHLRDDRQGPTEIAVLKPEDLEKCLAYALHLSDEEMRRRLVTYLCLGGFAGLRTEEILNAYWEDVDFAAGEIYVRQPKRVRGWKPRYVEMMPAFRFHVRLLAPTACPVETRSERRRADGSFGRNTAKILPGGQRTLYLLRRTMMDALGWKKWPENCLRHSYGTYWLAEFNDLAKLRNLMGHESEDVTRARYAMAAKKAARKEWWRMRVKV